MASVLRSHELNLLPISHLFDEAEGENRRHQRKNGNYYELKRKVSRFIADLLILLKLSLLFLLYFFHPFKIFRLYIIMDVKVQELKISNFYKQAFLRRCTLGVLHTSGNARFFGGTILETTGAYEGNNKNTKTDIDTKHYRTHFQQHNIGEFLESFS